MKKLLIALTIFCSGLLFITRTKAVSSAPVSSRTIKYFSDNNNVYVNNSSNQENNLPRFYSLFEANKKEYPYYMILYYENKFHLYVFDSIPNYYLYYYIATDNTPRQMFYNQYDAPPTFKYRDVTTGNTLSDEKTMSWNTIYSTGSYASVVVFDSNFPIQIIGGYNTCGGCSGRKGIDLQIGNLYYTYGDIIPTYSEIYPEIKKKYYNPISIDMSVKKNTVNANNKDYVLSEDLTITYNVDDYTKYIYQYKKSDDEDWINVGIVNNNSITINITENDTIYVRILDRNNNYSVVESATMTITDINYQEYLDENLKITFKSKNNLIDNKVASVNLNIDYGVIDNNKYIYLYKKNEDSNWTTVNLTSKSSIDILVNDNTAIIARIIEKNTYKVVKQNTMNITNIDYNLSIKFNAETLKDDFGNVYQTNVNIVFNSLNRDLFYYEYRTDYYVLNNQEFWTRLDDDKSNIIVQNRDNINLYARIVNKSTNEVIYTSNYKVIQNINKPNITFKTFDNLEYKNGKNYITSVTLTIDFGLIDNDKYVYQYKKSKDNVWTTLNLFNNNTDITITENDTIYARVLDYNTGDVVTSATITITKIDKENNLENIENIFDYVNKNNNTSTVFEFFGQVWNAFKIDNKLYNYLMLVISTSIILLVIKSMK